MARRQRKRRKGSDGHLITIGVILISLAVIALGVFAYFKFTLPQKPILESKSLCPTSGPRGISVVLLDTSDDLPETTRREVRQILNDLIEKTPAYYKFDVRVLDASRGKSRSLFSMCNPGDGTGLSNLTDNPVIARKLWLERFRKPAEQAMMEGMRPDRATSTPLMGAIQDIAIGEFSAAKVQNIPKSLVIISDMLEHTRDYSQYPSAGDLSYERYRRSPAYLKYRTDLHGAEVTIDYVQRLNVKRDLTSHITFWSEWIRDNRGRFHEARRLQGAG